VLHSSVEFRRGFSLWFCILFVGICLALPALADPPAGYYNSADTSTPETLRNSVHFIIDSDFD